MARVALLTKSQLLQESRNVPDALKLLDGFIAGNLAGQSPEIYAQYQTILACSLASTGLANEGSAHRDRAERIYQDLSHAPGLIELTRCWQHALKSNDPGRNDESIPPDVVATPVKVSTPGSIVQSVAGLLLLADRPELLARGIVDLVDIAGAVELAVATIANDEDEYDVLATTGQPDGDKRAFRKLPRHLDVGSVQERPVEVWIAPKDRPRVDRHRQRRRAAAVHRPRARARPRRTRRAAHPLADRRRPDRTTAAVVGGHMRELMLWRKRVATTNVSVLITGESGTGKEILARAIHRYSDRADKPFIPFNCTAVPRDMLESQLFGHRRGAFTGADRDHPGLIRAARDGTLFLDEIGELSLDLQPKLLRFLESGEICPLGETTPFTVNVRIVAATNANLEAAVKDGRFREDLFYRLNVIRLHDPAAARAPRRDSRRSSTTSSPRAADEFRKGRVRIAEETMEHLLLYPWPGNIRQLQNELRRMVALAEPDAVLTPARSPRHRRAARPRPGPPAQANGAGVPRADEKLTPTLARIEREMIQVALREASRPGRRRRQSARHLPQGPVPEAPAARACTSPSPESRAATREFRVPLSSTLGLRHGSFDSSKCRISEP